MKKALAFLVTAVALTSCAQVLTTGAAVVNGVRISQARLDNEVKGQLSSGSQTPQSQENKLQVSRQVLARLIINELQLGEAKRRGITADPATVQQQFQQVRSNPQITSDADFRKRLADFGLTPETFRERIRDGIILEELLKRIAGPIPETQIAAVYRQERAQFRQIKLKHIQLRIDAKHPDIAQHAKALDLVDKLKKGASFAVLARQNSDDADTKRTGGQFPGFIQIANITDPALSEALWAAKKGAVMAPRKSQNSWEIFVVLSKRVQPLSEVRAELESQLQQQADQGAQRDFVQTAVKKADIVVNPRYGDWDATSISVVPHQAVVPPDNATDENAPIDTGGLTIPDLGS